MDDVTTVDGSHRVFSRRRSRRPGRGDVDERVEGVEDRCLDEVLGVADQVRSRPDGTGGAVEVNECKPGIRQQFFDAARRRGRLQGAQRMGVSAQEVGRGGQVALQAGAVGT
jgi:hypothetical protein